MTAHMGLKCRIQKIDEVAVSLSRLALPLIPIVVGPKSFLPLLFAILNRKMYNTHDFEKPA